MAIHLASKQQMPSFQQLSQFISKPPPARCLVSAVLVVNEWASNAPPLCMYADGTAALTAAPSYLPTHTGGADLMAILDTKGAHYEFLALQACCCYEGAYHNLRLLPAGMVSRCV